MHGENEWTSESEQHSQQPRVILTIRRLNIWSIEEEAWTLIVWREAEREAERDWMLDLSIEVVYLFALFLLRVIT